MTNHIFAHFSNNPLDSPILICDAKEINSVVFVLVFSYHKEMFKSNVVAFLNLFLLLLASGFCRHSEMPYQLQEYLKKNSLIFYYFYGLIIYV